jgi:hypothetical protein
MPSSITLLEFQELWSEMRYHPRRQNPNRFDFHCSFLDAHLLRELVVESKREEFAGKLYAQGLMIQVAHSTAHFSRIFISSSEEKENTFPRVNGVLSTMYHHVCPAVLPSMLLYLEPSLVVGDDSDCYCVRSRDLEQSLWISKSEVFDNAIKNLLLEHDALNKVLFYSLDEYIERSKDIPSAYLYDFDQSSESDVIDEYYSELMEWIDKREFHQKILNCHTQLKKFILDRDDSQRITNF